MTMPDIFGGPTLDDLRKLWAGQPDWYYTTTAGPLVEPVPPGTSDAAKPVRDLTDLDQFEKWIEEQDDSQPTIQPVQLGWQCPRCGQCYAPFVSRCEVCVPRTVSSNTIRLSE